MDRLTLDQVQHVARLAALSFSEEEALAMRDELGAILSFVASLDALDVTGIEATWHALELGVALRPDRVEPSGLREAMLAAAPVSEQGAFAVPKVLDGDE